VIVRAAGVWTPQGLRHDTVVELEGRRIVDLRAPRSGDPEPQPGLLVPGLVNAHLHLELSWMVGQVPGGQGFTGWVQQLMRTRSAPTPTAPERREAARAAAARMFERGVAAACDISNGGDTAELLVEAGLSGIVQREFLGMDPRRTASLVAAVEACEDDHRVGSARVRTRPSPHAVVSTAPELLVASGRPRGGVPGSIHLAETLAEADFLRDGSGDLATFLDDLGVPWQGWEPPGCSGATYLERLGLLGPDLLLVHGVHLDAADRALIAARGAPLCLCPRSNLHIEGRLPDVPALLEAGVPLCLGTDSLASNADLDVLGEVGSLMRAFPEIPPGLWLDLATRGGAEALGLESFGRLQVGASPGLLLLEVDTVEALVRPPRRQWICGPAA